MIQIICPACQKLQPESELMIDSALKQNCHYCGVIFEVNVTKNAFLGTEKLTGKIVSKGLLDHTTEESLAFKVEPKIRTLFGIILFLVGAAVVMSVQGKLEIVLLSGISFAAGVLAGMLAGRLGYSEILTPGGAGFPAGLVLSLLIALKSGGSFQDQMRTAFPIFGIYSLGSFLGGVAAWALRKFFDVKLGDTKN